MHDPIQHVVVIGAGTMGAQIAAHFANAGTRVTLLDIVPDSLTEAERKAGKTLEDRDVRNRIVRAGLEAAAKARPAAFMAEMARQRVSIGNLQDDFEAVSQADWVIEAIIEKLDIKRELMERIDKVRRPGSIISTNTSGIPVHEIAAGRSTGFREHFLGTHFFNPPRYLKLLELIPTEDTAPAVLDRVREFAEQRLGKGVVIAKDTPNFIANRLGSVSGAFLMDYVLREGYSVEEVDALTGPLIGRPKTASFRLLDLVGLDVATHVRGNLAQALPDDPAAKYLHSEQASRVTDEMIEQGWLGNKAGQGFYKPVEGEDGKEYWALDLETLEYKPQGKPRFESVAQAKDRSTPAERIAVILEHDDRAAKLLRETLYHGFGYASGRIPEIADTPKPIDDAMRWGFMHDQGPFQLWDDLGVRETAQAMTEAGHAPAEWVTEMLAAGYENFYQSGNGHVKQVYSPVVSKYVDIEGGEKRLSLRGLRSGEAMLEENDGASLFDAGEGVLLLEFHTKGNALDEDVFRMTDRALELLESSYSALVIGNEADNFSLGANLFTVAVAAQNGMWDQLDEAVRTFQRLNMRMRTAPRPVIVAPAGMTLGGGCELTMHSGRTVAAAETYIGLVEVGAGVIPAGGGCKEMLRRVVNPVARIENADPLPPLQKVFETLGQAKTATSAFEALELGFLGPSDRIVMNRDQRLAEARREAIHLAQAYRPNTEEKIYAGGRDLLSALRMGIFTYQEGNYISDHDALIGEKLAYILSGGELSQPQWVDPWYILDLEREAFLSLSGEEKSQARMWALLQTGKPLRN